MKNILLFALVVLVSLAACKKKPEKILVSIGEKREKIDKKLKDYTFRRVDDIVGAGTGIVSGYFRDEEAKKVLTEQYSKDKRSYAEYYFDDGMLIYVVSQDFIYNKPTTYTEEQAKQNQDTEWYDDSKTRLEINKYYFNDNKLLKWTGRTDADTPVNIAEFTSREPAVLAQAIIALRQLKEEE